LGRSLVDRIINAGGSIGRFIGTDVGTWGFKIVKPNSIVSLRSAIQSNSKDLWGMVVFGHGPPGGDLLVQSNVQTITDEDGTFLDPSGAGTLYINQSVLRGDVSQSGYKLARIYMMQCYSADGPHGAAWKQLTNDFFGYKGLNVIGFDMNWLNPLDWF
jgi:hypothetical protein